MHPITRAGCLLALCVPWLAHADDAADLKALRQEVDSLRSTYETRLKALEDRLRAAEAASSNASLPAALPTPPVAAAPEAAPLAAAAASPGGAGPSSGTGFNPNVSMILSGIATRTSRDPAQYRLSGFPLPPDAEIGPGTRGFSLAETELGLSANIDPWFSGTANIAFRPDNTVGVEEAYIQTTSLGNGLTVKAGRYFSSIGYLNSQHSHVWDFVDAPLAYQAFLGTQYADDGVQVAWLAPTDQYIELRGELGRGLTFPGTGSSRNGAGSAALSLHTGGDIGDSSSWRAGLSVLQAKASDQPLLGIDALGVPATRTFNGSTRVWVADAVWKWSPNGNATRTNLKVQGEYLRSTRDGTLADGSPATAEGPWATTQSGWYLQTVYQFMPRWRVGARYDRLDPGSLSASLATPAFYGEGVRPQRESLMLDWSPSEFSRVRLQFAQDRSRPGAADHQWFLQYQMSLGAHGAHSF